MPQQVGGYSAADVVSDTVTGFKPRWVVLVGIAGGFTESGVEVGDVVVASKIYSYEYGKIKEGAFKRRDTFDIAPDPAWLARVRVEVAAGPAEQRAWTGRIKAKRPDRRGKHRTRVLCGPVASGEKVVDDSSYQFFAEIKGQLPDLCAVEMEGAGAGTAIEHIRTQDLVGFFMIRGISDTPRQGSEKADQPVGTAQRDAWKLYAAAAAAAFLEHLLSQPGTPAPSRQPLDEKETSAIQLKEVYKDLTLGLANILRGRTPTAARLGLRASIEAFFSSSHRWGVLVGHSGVGKSVEMADTALRLVGEGRTALLVSGRSLELDELARTITSRLSDPPKRADWYHHLIAPWATARTDNDQGFVLLIDGLDERSPPLIEQELMKLSMSLQDVPLDRIRILLSCSELVWEGLKFSLPFFNTTLDTSVHETAAVISVTDFDGKELDNALEIIGADDYSTSVWKRGLSDPHVDSIRDLLQHPETFAIFAELYADNALPNRSSITWVELIESFTNRALGRASSQCSIPVGTIRESMITLAKLARQSGSRDFRVDAETVRSALPNLGLDDTDIVRSIYAALLRRGILEESDGPGARRLVGFRLRNIGGYFLSFTLERETEGNTHHKVGEVVSSWIEDIFEYPPVIDAVVAWAHRLESTDPKHAALVDALVTNPSLRIEVVFRLMPPTSAMALLGAVTQMPSDSVGPYREALMAMRPSPEALTAFRRGLTSRDSRVVRLAIRAVGGNQDAEAAPNLVELLGSDDKELRRLAINALGQIGAPSLPFLLPIIEDVLQPESLRLGCLFALRATGYRTPEITFALEVCLSENRLVSKEVKRAALMAAATLRVSGFTNYAISAVRSSSGMEVMAGAKLLAEMPDVQAERRLINSLKKWNSRGSSRQYRRMIFQQISVALLRLPNRTNAEVVLTLLRDNLSSGSHLTPLECVWIAEKLPTAAARGLILNDLADKLNRSVLHNYLWNSLRILSEVWRPEDLDALADISRQWSMNGIRLDRLLVDTLIEASTRGEGHPLDETNAQRYTIETLVRLQLPDTAIELARLLQHFQWPVDQYVADALWALGDDRIEGALLEELKKAQGEDNQARSRRRALIWVLGTCGGRSTAGPLLQYLASAPLHDIEIGFSEEVLIPLVSRGVLHTAQLVEIAENKTASEDGRIACVLALAQINASDHTDTFLLILRQDVGAPLRAYAAGALGLTNDAARVTAELLHVLRTTQDALVAGRAATALGNLGHLQAVGHIEEALRTFGSTENVRGLITGLALLRHPESVPAILDVLHDIRFPHAKSEALESLGEFWPNNLVRQTILECLESSSGGWADHGDQTPAINVLARHDPNLLLSRATEMYPSGHLEPSAKQSIAHWAPDLAEREDVNRNTLMLIMSQLVSDRDFWVREQALQAMTLMPSVLCQSIYDSFVKAPDEWSIACGVRSLGYWLESELDVETERVGPSRLIREAAEETIKMHYKRQRLRKLYDMLDSKDTGKRCSAFYALEEQGDESAIWELHRRSSEDSMAAQFLSSLDNAINRRRRQEHGKRGKEEDRHSEELGVVSFD
jgi:HEAT repeat protein/nucleoside phosphorylase